MTTRRTRIPLKVHEGVKRDYLAEKFAELEFTKGAEIGVRYGEFSEVLCQKNPKLKLYSIDPWDLVYNDYRSHALGGDKQNEAYKIAKERLKPYNCELIKKTSLDAMQDFDNESLDFVYIDGSHEFDYVMLDIITWSWKVKKGGIISGHDYYEFRWGDVIRSVDNYAYVHKVQQIDLTDERTPSWWFERTW